MRCFLCEHPLVSTGRGRPPRYCCAAHRVTFHRLQKRSGDNLAAAVRDWRATHLPPKPAAPPQRKAPAASLELLAELVSELEPLGGQAPLRKLAARARHLLDVLDAAPGLEPRLAAGALWELTDALTQLEAERDVLEALAALEDHADQLAALAPSLRALRLSASALQELVEEPHDVG